MKATTIDKPMKILIGKQFTVEEIALKYVDVLRDWLTEEQFLSVVTDTGDGNEHDFCDANMAVDQAFRDLGIDVDTSDDNHCAMWNLVTARSVEIMNDLSHCCGAFKTVDENCRLYCKKCFEEV